MTAPKFVVCLCGGTMTACGGTMTAWVILRDPRRDRSDDARLFLNACWQNNTPEPQISISTYLVVQVLTK